MSRSLSHTEKLVLALCRNVTGTISLIASILILHKIYRCYSYKKQQLLLFYYQQQQSLSNHNNENTPTIPTTTPHGITTAISPTDVRDRPIISNPTTALTVTNHNTTNIIIRADDDGYTPISVLVHDDGKSSSTTVVQQGITPITRTRHHHHHDQYSTANSTSDITTLSPTIISSSEFHHNTTTNVMTVRQQQQQPQSPSHTGGALIRNTTNPQHPTTATTATTTSIMKPNTSFCTITTVYQRLLIGASILDVFHSFWSALSTIPVPSSSGVVFGFGTTATCTMQGFFVQFSGATPIYFAALTIYFMLKVRYNISDETLHQYYEFFFHAIPIIIALGGGISGIVLQVFNPIALPELGCWVSPYPIGCQYTNSCTRGYKIASYSDWYAWLFAFVWFFLSFFVVLICTIIIYVSIYHRERFHFRRHHRRPAHMVQTNAQTTVALSSLANTETMMTSTICIKPSENVHNDEVDDDENDIIDMANDMHIPNDEIDDQPVYGDQQPLPLPNVFENIIEDDNLPDSDEMKTADHNSDNIVDDDHQQEENDNNNDDNDNNNVTMGTNHQQSIHTDISSNLHRTTMTSQTRPINNLLLGSQHRRSTNHHHSRDDYYQHRQRRYRNSNRHRNRIRVSRIAAIQCLLYVSTALFTTVWSVMPWVGKKLKVNSQWRFFFAFMFNIFNPLQGFFTLIIFIRLQYLRLRVMEPSWSRIQCLKYCLFSPDAK